MNKIKSLFDMSVDTVFEMIEGVFVYLCLVFVLFAVLLVVLPFDAAVVLAVLYGSWLVLKPQ